MSFCSGAPGDPARSTLIGHDRRRALLAAGDFRQGRGRARVSFQVSPA